MTDLTRDEIIGIRARAQDFADRGYTSLWRYHAFKYGSFLDYITRLLPSIRNKKYGCPGVYLATVRECGTRGAINIIETACGFPFISSHPSKLVEWCNTELERIDNVKVKETVQA